MHLLVKAASSLRQCANSMAKKLTETWLTLTPKSTDLLRLSQLLTPTTRIPLAKKIVDDMTKFLAALSADTTIDSKVLQLGNVTIAELVVQIATAYEILLPL